MPPRSRAPLTDKQYVRRRGGKCPHCRGDNIEGSECEMGGRTASQEVTCNDCHAEWLDCYELTGWEPVRDPEPAEDATEDDHGNQPEDPHG